MQTTSSNTSDADTASERRKEYGITERRKPSLRSIVYGMFNPRRRRVRRDEDWENAFLDWHPRSLLVVATTILLLSVLDGLLTVKLINAGAQEINPLLAVLVDHSAAWFALIKWLLTAVGVIGLVEARVFGRIKAKTVLYGVMAAYAILVLYGYSLTQSIPA
jgi:hypothetical protein